MQNGHSTIILSPSCPRCGSSTRLVGIEPHPRLAQFDLRTYGCGTCEDMSTAEVPRDIEMRLLRHPS